MEPIKINIEVSLSEATIAALKGLLGAQVLATPAQEAEPQPQPEKKATPAPAPAPQPEPEQPAAPVVEEDDDLPPGNEATPAPMPTESDARNAVQAARKRGVSAKTIKDYMQSEFGIASSVECPAERRKALIDGLANLAA